MSNQEVQYREIVRTLPLDEACNLIALQLRQSNLQVLQNLNAIIYPSETYPLDAAQERALVRQAALHAYRTMDVIRELLVDGLLRRLRENYPDKTIEDDLTSYVIRLANYAIDISDVDEIIDETDETITLNGYIAGEHQIVTLSGSDAQRMKAWFDQDQERALQIDETENKRSPRPPRISASSGTQNNNPEESGEPPF